MARCDESTRYWTQNEMNSRLVELGGTMLFNRALTIVIALLFLGFTVWRFSMTERAPSKRKLAQARQAPGARYSHCPGSRRRWTAAQSVARDARPSTWVQFMTRLRIEVRQVLTSPGLIVLSLFAIGNTAAGPVARPVDLRHFRASNPVGDDQHRARRISRSSY